MCRILSTLAALIAVALMLVAPTIARAEHPDTDDAERTLLDGVPWTPGDVERDNPACDPSNDGGGYISMDWEFWDCRYDPGDPGVPGSGGFYWEPNDSGYDPTGGDVAWSRKWAPTSIPGHPGVVYRLLPRTEWTNPTGTGVCPNVTGGCKLFGGADINLQLNGKPFLLAKSWFNQAAQMYVYNATTKVWDLKEDTGWKMNASPDYTSKLIATYAYGTAKYGAAWYFVRGWARVWNGSAWSPSVYTQPATGVWDAKPGDTTKKPPKPVKLPKVKQPKAGVVAPPDAVPTPGG